MNNPSDKPSEPPADSPIHNGGHLLEALLTEARVFAKELGNADLYALVDQTLTSPGMTFARQETLLNAVGIALRIAGMLENTKRAVQGTMGELKPVMVRVRKIDKLSAERDDASQRKAEIDAQLDTKRGKLTPDERLKLITKSSALMQEIMKKDRDMEAEQSQGQPHERKAHLQGLIDKRLREASASVAAQCAEIARLLQADMPPPVADLPPVAEPVPLDMIPVGVTLDILPADVSPLPTAGTAAEMEMQATEKEPPAQPASAVQPAKAESVRGRRKREKVKREERKRKHVDKPLLEKDRISIGDFMPIGRNPPLTPQEERALWETELRLRREHSPTLFVRMDREWGQWEGRTEVIRETELFLQQGDTLPTIILKAEQAIAEGRRQMGSGRLSADERFGRIITIDQLYRVQDLLGQKRVDVRSALPQVDLPPDKAAQFKELLFDLHLDIANIPKAPLQGPTVAMPSPQLFEAEFRRRAHAMLLLLRESTNRTEQVDTKLVDAITKVLLDRIDRLALKNLENMLTECRRQRTIHSLILVTNAFARMGYSAQTICQKMYFTRLANHCHQAYTDHQSGQRLLF